MKIVKAYRPSKDKWQGPVTNLATMASSMSPAYRGDKAFAITLYVKNGSIRNQEYDREYRRALSRTLSDIYQLVDGKVEITYFKGGLPLKVNFIA